MDARGCVSVLAGLVTRFCGNLPLSAENMLYRFADCALDTQLYTLDRAGQSTRLPPKVFEVLCISSRIVTASSLSRNCVTRSRRGWRSVMPPWRAACVPCASLGRARASATYHPDAARLGIVLWRTCHCSPTRPRPSCRMDPHPRTAPGGARGATLCGLPLHQSGGGHLLCGVWTRLRQPCAHCGQAILLPAAFCPACGQRAASHLRQSLGLTATVPKLHRL